MPGPSMDVNDREEAAAVRRLLRRRTARGSTGGLR